MLHTYLNRFTLGHLAARPRARTGSGLMLALTLFMTAWLTTSCQPAQENIHFDLVVVNGRVETMDPSLGEVSAFAVRNGRIAAVGGDVEIRKLIGPDTEIVDARGRFVMPGFIESHAHFAELGAARRRVDLVGTKSFLEVLRRCREFARELPDGTWILGRGWDQNLWPTKSFPRHDELSAAFPNHPVLLTRVDGHAVLANAKAMELASVTKDSPIPPGGEMILGDDGRPTGIFVDMAEAMITAVLPAAGPEALQADLLAAQEECLRYGITSFHDCGISPATLAEVRKLYDQGELELRLYLMIGGSGTTEIDFEALGTPTIGEYGNRLSVRAIKLGIDGALGSHGAALLEDYRDRPGHRGLMLMSEEQLEELSRRALQRGWQVAVHAIGDRGNRSVLDVWERLFREFPTGTRARFRIEHAQVLDKEDLPRLRKLGIIASMQACHGTSDLPWAIERLGAERIEEGAYAWRKLIDLDTIFCLGTDAPVESVSPFNNLWAAVTRDFGVPFAAGSYHDRQRLTRRQALASYTTAGAYASFEESSKGRIGPGMYADFIIVDRDLRNCTDEDLRGAAVDETWIAGERVFRR